MGYQCTGFSTWAINVEKEEAKIELEAGDTVDKRFLVVFEDLKPFVFNKYGILVDESYQSKGSVEIEFKIRCKNGLNLLKKSNNFEINFSLTSLNTVNLLDYLLVEQNVIQGEFYSSFSSYTNVSGSNPTGLFNLEMLNGKANSKIEFNIESNNLESQQFIYFVLVYNFDFSKVFSDFETKIYENLISDGKISFGFNIGIEFL